MQRFYINFQHINDVVKDEEGVELTGLEEAKAIAMASAREILADNIKSDSIAPLSAVIITDESGQELMVIPAKNLLPDTWKN
jgi:uncharacterized protein DUF6894